MKPLYLFPLALVILHLGATVRAEDKPQPIPPMLQALVDQQVMTGVVVLVADKDKVLELDAVGYSSLRTKAPMRTDSLFWIASMTKSMTATALMMLVDEGKVAVSDPVEKVLREFKGQAIAGDDQTPAHPPRRPITIKDVLTHTSGLILAGDRTLKREHSLATNVANIAALPLRQEPGTKYEYNNSGIMTAGRIIEVVSGMPYAEFMQRRLFDPLGMKDTTFWPTEEQAARLARSARRAEDQKSLEEVQQDKGLTPATIKRLSNGVMVPAPVLADMGVDMVFCYAHRYADPAGGLYSTANDVGVFCQMLLNGGVHRGKRLLSTQAVGVMTSNQTGDVPVSPQEAYGLGWSVKLRADEGPSIGSFGHRGARRTAMWVDPLHRLAMVVLVERMDMSGDEQKLLYGSVLKAVIARYGQPAP